MSALLHQDELMWSRVQFLVAIQAAALGGGYASRADLWTSLGILTLGAFLTTLLVGLVMLDRRIRDAAYVTAPNEDKPAVDRDRFCLGLLIFLLGTCTLLASDFILGAGILHGCQIGQAIQWQPGDRAIATIAILMAWTVAMIAWLLHRLSRPPTASPEVNAQANKAGADPEQTAGPKSVGSEVAP